MFSIKTFIFGIKDTSASLFPSIASFPELETFQDQDLTILFWSTNSPLYQYHSLAKGSHVAVFTVDLAQDLTENVLQSLKACIDALKENDPASKLYLLGLNFAPEANYTAFQNVQLSLSDYKFDTIMGISENNPRASEQFMKKLTQDAQNISDTKIKAQQLEDLNNNILPMELALKRCQKESPLYNAISELMVKTRELSAPQIRTISKATLDLLNEIENPDIKNKATVIQKYVDTCNDAALGKYHNLKNAVYTVALTAALTIVAALIGFGVGFALGAWSGPGAFFSGLALGNASALALVGGTTTCGFATLGYSGYKFFQPSGFTTTVHDVAKLVNPETNDLSAILIR